MSKQKIDKHFLVVNEESSSNILGKAEKMFSELGFEKTLHTKYEIIYKLERHNLWRTITFKNIGHWEYSTEEKMLINGDYEYKGLSIYDLLYQAITQQMKELGWI